jgi:hypothetical protein
MQNVREARGDQIAALALCTAVWCIPNEVLCAGDLYVLRAPPCTQF